jgi:hypothetical protein
MTRSKSVFLSFLAAGWVIGPAAWAVNTELGQILPSAHCATAPPVLGVSSVVGLLMALATAFLSWRTGGNAGRTSPTSHARATDHFIGTVGALLGLVFTFVLIFQAAASVVLVPCEF